MSTMKFDTAAIGELADRLAALRNRLGAAGSLPLPTVEQFGSAELEARVKDFSHNWSDGINRIVDELHNTRLLLMEAAAEYGDTETEVRGGMEGRS